MAEIDARLRNALGAVRDRRTPEERRQWDEDLLRGRAQLESGKVTMTPPSPSEIVPPAGIRTTSPGTGDTTTSVPSTPTARWTESPSPARCCGHGCIPWGIATALDNPQVTWLETQVKKPGPDYFVRQRLRDLGVRRLESHGAVLPRRRYAELAERADLTAGFRLGTSRYRSTGPIHEARRPGTRARLRLDGGGGWI